MLPIYQGVSCRFRFILFQCPCSFPGQKIFVIITHILTGVKYAMIIVRLNLLKAYFILKFYPLSSRGRHQIMMNSNFETYCCRHHNVQSSKQLFYNSKRLFVFQQVTQKVLACSPSLTEGINNRGYAGADQAAVTFQLKDSANNNMVRF